MYKKPKISIVGTGSIGTLLGQMISYRNIADISMIDINKKVLSGKALDIMQAGAIYGSDTKIEFSDEYDSLAGSDVVVVTAGIPRKPGMSRNDLIDINKKIISSVAKNISKYCPQSFVIVVTNPLDIMVQLMMQESAMPAQRVVGMAGVLDSGRFAHFISKELDISTENINCFVLGGHGDSMVPLVNYSTVAGISLTQIVKMGWMSQETLDKIISRTKSGGGEIVSLLGNGSAYHAPVASILDMIDSYLFGKRKILPAAAMLSGEYGYSGLYVGVPIIIGSGGVEKIVEVELSKQEREDFAISVENLQKLLQSSL